MLGLNEIKSEVNLPSEKIIALCESMLERMDDNEMRRLRNTDGDGYLRSVRGQFKELNDRYPSIFNVLLEFGRRTPDGFSTMDRITRMLRQFDAVQAQQKTKDQAEKELDYEYAQVYVKPVVDKLAENTGVGRFDDIVKDPRNE